MRVKINWKEFREQPFERALCVKECQHQKSITIQKPVSDDDDNDDGDDNDGDDNDGDDDDNDDGDDKDGDDDVDDDSAETERQVSFLWQPNHIRPPLYPTISNPDLHNWFGFGLISR